MVLKMLGSVGCAPGAQWGRFGTERNQFKGWVLLLNSVTGVFPLCHLQRHETCMRFEMKSLFL